ncbi:MAG: transporter substrate-binding domain-containing protein [Desulfobulbus sp.]|nr:transporter substrate-binding domain-containing protein [Desulfobulbus sp.]
MCRTLGKNNSSLLSNCCRRLLVARQIAVVFFVVTLFALFYAQVSAAQLEEPVSHKMMLRLAIGEWPPYTGQHLPGYGCDSRVVTEAFALVGIRVEYAFLPWARGMLLSRNGLVEGTFEWEDTPAHRKSHFVSSRPISRQEWVFFYRKGTSVDWQQLEDLRQQRIGLTIGYAYSDVFKAMQNTYPATFIEAASDVLNFKKLLNRRIDLLPMERAVGQYLLESRFTAQEQAAIGIYPKPIKEFSPHLLLSRAIEGNEKRMQLFEQGLQQLQGSGRYGEIMAACLCATP